MNQRQIIQKKSLTVVGSVALDTIKTPFGGVDRALGGSAVYFSCAARFFAPVHMVGVVGRDFPESHLRRLEKLGIDTSEVKREQGKTFFWKGHYEKDLNSAITEKTELNVFGDFNPILSKRLTRTPYLFLANIHPALQLNVLKQVRKPRWIASDTMNFWISCAKKQLINVLKHVNISLMNDAEIRQFTGEDNLSKAVKQIMKLGPSIVVVKRGEYGCGVFTKHNHLISPAYLLDAPKDPTGAGDSFAGAFLGYLTRANKPNLKDIRQALINANIIASFNVESFTINRLASLTKPQIAKRKAQYKASLV